MAKNWVEVVFISLLFLLLAVVSTFPLITSFDTAIPYAPFGGEKVWNRSGDQIQLLYWFWLVKENFLGSIPFNSNPFEFNMGTINENSGLNTIPLAFLYMLFSPLGDVAAYNATIFSSYVLAGLFMYLLVKLYSGSKSGALIAAIVFTLVPSRVKGFTAGHGYGLLYFCYPFILYYLEVGIRSKKIRYGVVSSVGIIGLAMLEPHLIYYLCVFLGLFIPYRVCTVIHGNTIPPRTLGLPFRPHIAVSLLVQIGSGLSAMTYVHLTYIHENGGAFFTDYFWWASGMYSIVMLIMTIVFATVYQMVFGISKRDSLAIEAISTVLLWFLVPLAFVHIYIREVNSDLLLMFLFIGSISLRIWFLRTVLVSAVKYLLSGLYAIKKHVYPILPLIFSMGAIVYWMAFSKVEDVASTVAGGGRSLDDVAIFSAQIKDLFDSTSNVYIGLVPGVLLLGSLLYVCGTVFSKQSIQTFSKESLHLFRFYSAIAVFSIVLALGLAFEHLSLYKLFFEYFPFFNYPRVSDRIITMGLFSLAIIIGYSYRGIHTVLNRVTSTVLNGLLVILLVAHLLYDFNVFKPMGVNVLDKGQDIYGYIQKHIGDNHLLEIPLWPGDSHQSSLYQHYIMLDRVKRINGSSPMVLNKYISTVIKPLDGVNQGRITEEIYKRLIDLKVRYVTVHDNRDIFVTKVSPFVPLTTVRRFQNSQYFEEIKIDNRLHFKDWDKENPHLYLFRVKDKEELVVNDSNGWYAMPFFYSPHWRMKNQVGRVVPDKINNHNVFQAKEGSDKEGYLVYGPYDVYPPGSYRCYFSIRAKGKGDESVARLEIAKVRDDGQVVVLDQKEVYCSSDQQKYLKKFIDFTINEDTKLEFRVFYYGKGEVTVEKVVMNWQGNDSPLSFVYAEKMVGDTGQVVSERKSASGKVIEAVPKTDRNGRMVYGPDRLYDSGKYKAIFSVRKTSDSSTEDDPVAAQFFVTNGLDTRIFSERLIKSSQVDREKFTTIDVPFTLDQQEFLRFQVKYTGTIGLQLDGIAIEPVK